MHVQAQAHSTQVGPLREGTFDACTLYTPDRCGRQPSIKEAKKPRGATAAGTVWPRSNSKCAQAPQVAPKKQAAPLSTRAAGPAPENPKPSTAVKPAAGPRKGHYGSYVHTHLNVRAHSGSVAHSHAPNSTCKHGTHDAIYCTSSNNQVDQVLCGHSPPGPRIKG